jgi:hypothetical protein
MDYQGCSAQIDLEGMLADENIKPKALPFSLLKEITDSFSQYCEIGTGGFAVVYKVHPPLSSPATDCLSGNRILFGWQLII